MRTDNRPKPKFRVIVAGGRDFADYETLRKAMDMVLEKKMMTHQIIIVSGMARGADLMGVQYARERTFSVAEYPAEWERYGKVAGFIRNEAMAHDADALVAFWDGKSPGTAHMIRTAKKYRLPTRVIRYAEKEK